MIIWREGEKLNERITAIAWAIFSRGDVPAAIRDAAADLDALMEADLELLHFHASVEGVEDVPERIERKCPGLKDL
jgi:hypothetical protein